MILKISCPSCFKAYRLTPPYPSPGKRYRCTCEKIITVTYPEDLETSLLQEGLLQGLDAATVPPDQAVPSPSPASIVSPPLERPASPLLEPPAAAPAAREVPGRPASVDGNGDGAAASTRGEDDGFVPPPPGPMPIASELAARSLPPPPALVQTLELPESPVEPKPVPKPGSAPHPAELLTPEDARPPAPDTSPAVGQDLEAPEEIGAASAPTFDRSPVASMPGSPAPVAEVPHASAPETWPAPVAEVPRRKPHRPRPAPPPEVTPRPPRRLWPWVLGAALVLPLGVGLLVALAVIYHYGQELPPLDGLRTYRPPITSRVYARDGQLIGEFFGEERRYVVPYDQIPKRVVQAFVAAEDAGFFEHHGIDYRGIVRAMLTNLREQRMAQGASTITQQVARSFLLTREKKLERKIIEALLASRIEVTFSKEHILTLYLNQIYLGEGAYGVAAAARVYFNKELAQLSLAEIALIAGLPPAPSRYSPLDHYLEARDRQQYVLRSMVKQGYLTQAEADEAQREDLALVPRRNINRELAPFVTEQVRRYLVGRYGDELVLKGGLEVHTTIDLTLQQAAQRAVRSGVAETDRRIGWRGPEQTLPPDQVDAFARAYEEEFIRTAHEARPGGSARFGPPAQGPMPLELHGIYRAVARVVRDRYAIVQVGSHSGVIRLETIQWAYSVNPKRSWKYRELDVITRVMKPGDVFDVELLSLDASSALKGIDSRDIRKPRLEFTLTQPPALEGALLSYRLEDGGIVAMVGGVDFARSEFNRPMQARRQMGSAFKPLVYAAALDHPTRVYTPASIVLDGPVAMPTLQAGFSEVWKPSNYDMDYLGEITLRKALYLSRNTVAVKLLMDIGIQHAHDYIKKLGFTSEIERNLTMVLGTSSVTLLEMCRAYSAFADAGRIVEPVFISRVVDRDGLVLEERPATPLKTQVIPATTAYIMTSMLQDVVRQGTAAKAMSLKKISAGKTGTTNEFVDASYIGYTPQLVTGTWVGYDQPRSMGLSQTGGDVALPIWIEYMKEAFVVYPETDVPVPERVVFATIDAESGKLAIDSTASKVRLPFQEGEVPTETALEDDQVDTQNFLSADPGL